MFRALGISVLAIVGLLLPAVTAHAAQSKTSTQNWSQHDTAVYVVSTLNVLHSHRGKSTVAIMSRRLGVARFDVLDDLSSSDMYFIQLKRANGDVVGSFAYQMGWPKPMSLSPVFNRFGIPTAPDKVANAFRSDPKQLIGSFTSTLPS